MATESEEREQDDEIETDEADDDPPEAEAPSEEGDAAEDEPAEDDEGSSEGKPEEPDPDAPLTVTLGDEDPPPPSGDRAAEGWKKAQQERRELKRKVAELEAKVASAAPKQAPTLPPLGPEPKLSDPDIGYDGEALKVALRKHDEVKRKHDEVLAKAKADEQRQLDAWKARVEDHTKKATALAAPDWEDAQEVVKETLTVTQRAIIVQTAKDSAFSMLAIGRNPAVAKRLAAITDPVAFAVEFGRFERGTVKDDRRSPPPPPTRVSGTGRTAGGTDKKREALEAEADRTGNRIPVQRYDREQAEARKKK